MIFNNKTVIITGGSEGVGAATARLFAEAGANLMLVARSRKNLEIIAEELRDKTRVEIFAMDVSDPEDCVNVFKKAEYEFGRVDILINNAGFHARGPVEDVSPNDLGKMIDVNLRAPIMLTRIALPYLHDADEAAIINVGSLAGRLPVPHSAGYSATKSGLRAFTYAIADELRDTGIKIGVVSPGPIDTAFILGDIDATTELTFSQPMCTAEEVAQAILDLCGNTQVEQTMHLSSRIMTTIGYLAPSIRRLLLPLMRRKGARVKARLKAEAKSRDTS